MTEYKNIGLHAESLASGQMLGPGETSELDDDAVKDPYNAGLIEDGKLIKLEAKKAASSKGAHSQEGGEEK